MTDKHMETAAALADKFAERMNSEYRPGVYIRRSVLTELVTAALREAEREGMRRAAEIASEHSFACDIDWWLQATKKDVAAHSCKSVSAAILSEAEADHG